MFENVRQILWVRKNARAIKRHYLRWPYRIRKNEVFDDFNHEHTCLAARLTNVDLSEICPLEDKRNLIPGDGDECERCQYFGIICYRRNPLTGEKQIRFEMSGTAVSLFEDKEL